jgi:hypothetical protein
LLLFLLVVTNVPAQDADEFGSRFFEQLRTLFGQLEQSDLDRAFQQARPIRCSDLAARGEWKQVAFLNDDRSLGNWHLDTLEKVKRDLAKFVFSGTCRGEQGPVRLATSFPIQENLAKARVSQTATLNDVMRNNNPVSVIFDARTEAYTFQLPYLYVASRDGKSVLYTLYPDAESSRPAPAVAEEFRCKSSSSGDLTYRFMLCRTHVVDRDPYVQQRNEKQPLGNAAYYILSDGKEAGATVKLTFDAGTTVPKVVDTAEPAVPADRGNTAAEPTWNPASRNAGLVEIGNQEFRLRFDASVWKDRIDRRQLLADRTISDAAAAPSGTGKNYCLWKPEAAVPTAQLRALLDSGAGESVFFGLSFTKELGSPAAAVFEIQSGERVRLATLECYFPEVPTPDRITVARWSAVIGRQLDIEVRNR